MLHAHVFALEGGDVVVFANGGLDRALRKQHRLHTGAHRPVLHPLGAGKEAADAAHVGKLPNVLPGQAADALGGHFARVGHAAEGDVHGDGDLRAHVDAVDVAGGVGLGIAQPLRLAQHLVKARARGLHGVEDEVGGAVEDAAHPLDRVHAPRAQEVVQVGDAPADAGGNAHARAAVVGGLRHLRIVVGEHQLVGRDYALAGAQRAHHELVRRFQPAHQFHHGVDGLVFQYILKARGQFAAQPGDGAQIQHAGDLHVRAFGHDLVNARADGAHAQQSDSHDLSPSALR